MTVFVPRMKAIDKFNWIPYEEREQYKQVSGSAITGCPFLYYRDIVLGEEQELDDTSEANFLMGKNHHTRKERENRANPSVVLVEKSYFLFFKGKLKDSIDEDDDDYEIQPEDYEIKPFIMRVTPDCKKQGRTCLFYEDYKTTTKKSWYFKFKEYKEGLSPSYKKQLSLQNYADYCFTGEDVRKGAIIYIDKEDPDELNEMRVGDTLLTLQETEDYIFTHPAITENVEDIAGPTEYYHSVYKGLCKWKNCNRCDGLDLEKLKKELEEFEGDY
jgi:hypothetical protein